MKSRILIFLGVLLALAAALFFFTRSKQAMADINIYASPVQGGCYIANRNDCRIHLDPFTINITTASKLVLFKLVAFEMPGGAQTVIYDFRTDQSNPAPSSGTTYTPSLVAQDFAATCGHSYEISLQGQDSSNPSVFNLGLTSVFTCPSVSP
jgi:hypothetical protein